MNLILIPRALRTLLMFCCFLPFILFTSCGETTTEKSEKKDTDTVQTESVVENDSISKSILFFGDSLTAGMGLDPNDAFPALIQQKLDSLSLSYDVINAGLSGETTASGKNRLDWVLKQDVDIFVLELGANDGLRGIPLDETRKNLQAIIDAVKTKNPDTAIVLAGMQIPPNMGQEYTSEFRNIFPKLAEKNNIQLIPFLLKDVGGISRLNQPDGIHPTPQGHKIVANTVWETLKPLVSK